MLKHNCVCVEGVSSSEQQFIYYNGDNKPRPLIELSLRSQSVQIAETVGSLAL